MTNAQKRILIYSFAIFLVTELLKRAYIDIDISAATYLELSISSLIRVFNHYSLAVGLSGMLILGIRNTRKADYSIKSILMPSISFLLILFFCYLSASPYHILDKSIQFIKEKPYYAELLSTMENSLKSEAYQADSEGFVRREIARLKYQQTGLITDYLTPEGFIKTYRPTVKEVTQRNEFLKSEAEVTFWNQLVKRTIWDSMFFWALLTLVSLLIGFFSAISGMRSDH